MKHYISVNDGVVLLSTTPDNIGFTKADYLEGKLIELPENLVEHVEQLQFSPDIYDLLFPKQYYYIKSGSVIIVDNKLGAGYKLGVTYNDYLGGAFVELNDDQIEFYLRHRDASISAIWLCGVVPETIPTVDDVKSQKISELYQYDSSSAVNEFIINGIGAWFTPAERTNYNSSVSAAETLNIDSLMFYIGEMPLTVPTTLAKQMLAAVMLYADACYIVTKQHEATINNLKTIEEINAYDFTQGYPEKLTFSI